ncbi:MAG: HAMP domain-containing protein [Verrucomicrobia bacterium]|nr:HAMP domain-containing protein [Verrucomicrobiota bacterium]
MRIRTAIFVVYVAASAVGFAVLMRFMLAEVRPRYVTAVRQNLEETARLLARALEGKTVAQARATLGDTANFRAQLMTERGDVLADSKEAEPAAGSWYEAEPRSVRRMGERIIDGGTQQTDTAVVTTVPLRLADQPTARLVLSRSFRGVDELIWAERRKLSIMALLIAAVMVVAGWWIAVRMTRPIERLTAYARGVRDGRPAKVPVSRAVEVAELAQAFEQMRDALEGRQHVERYTQTLAHEVKAPLAAIRGAAELLGEEMPAEQREKFLNNIRSEAARIQQSVDRLLELSSLEARKALRQTERITAAELAREAAQALRPACEARRVTLTLEGDLARAPELNGERVLLREALVNLLQNALDFSPAGGAVALRWTSEAGRIVFTVEDNGPGVPDYALPRVFERFYSLPRPGTTRKSTGLGLALVREIAHLHDGDVTLVNRPEGGARAVLSVPVGSKVKGAGG